MLNSEIQTKGKIIYGTNHSGKTVSLMHLANQVGEGTFITSEYTVSSLRYIFGLQQSVNVRHVSTDKYNTDREALSDLYETFGGNLFIDDFSLTSKQKGQHIEEAFERLGLKYETAKVWVCVTIPRSNMSTM